MSETSKFEQPSAAGMAGPAEQDIAVRPTESIKNSAPTKIGVILGDLGKLNENALKYLVVHLNTLQQSFEFEIHSVNKNDPLLEFLSKTDVIDRNDCRKMLSDFNKRVIEQITEAQEDYKLLYDSLPEGFVLITMARFHDEHYGVKSENIHVQALGNWDLNMAPPSIFEFIITLLLSQAASIRTSLKLAHLGTKGCLFDFTAELNEARYKALQGFICSICREQLIESGSPNTADEVVTVLKKQWLGKVEVPHSPAGIVAKLGYNLFLTQGIKPTWWESVRTSLRDEGTKEFIKLISAIVVASLLLWLGLKA